MDLRRTLSWPSEDQTSQEQQRQRRLRKVNLQLRAQGHQCAGIEDPELSDIAGGLLQAYRERSRLLLNHRCPADQRIEAFLADHFKDLNLPQPLRLPDQTILLDEHGIARELSLPLNGDEFRSPLLTSFRVRNGVLHNPKADRRTTEGTFHVAEGGLPVPGDKKSVPKRVFAQLFRHAMNPPKEHALVPFTAGQPAELRSFVSLLIRPVVCPEVPGVCDAKTLEVRFFVPGTLVSNLDFVESIFGNGGDPYLAANDAGLDPKHWVGVTGCVIVVPHLTQLTKKELGLPSYDNATDRQKRDGMCWKSPDEKYNDGNGFKITCRDKSGVVVTLIADNYYGYCKKEVKTQISYAANLFGNVEEEHAGGALAFSSFSFGDSFVADPKRGNGRDFNDVLRDYSDLMDVQPEGYGIDRLWPNLLYIPHESSASVTTQTVSWKGEDGKERSIPLSPGKVYITPSGYKLRLEKHPGAPSWRIVGTQPEGTYCHKPCTVSGGGKSEISKSLRDYMLYGPVFVADMAKDFALIDEIVKKDYGNRWSEKGQVHPDYSKKASRPILSPERTLGSVIKLLTPSADYTDEYNRWLESIPNYIYPIVFIIKRFYSLEVGGDWHEQFGVDVVNGFPGHELKFGKRKLVGTYLRVGFTEDSSWRTFKLRQDYIAAAKIQMEDDITASVVIPAGKLSHLGRRNFPSYKFAVNCEYRLFQRPDDAIHRGLDKQTEADLSRRDNFISNFEPLTPEQVDKIVERVTTFDQYTPPMQEILREAAAGQGGYVVSSSEPRLVNGKPTKNPRYLQNRPDLMAPFDRYVADMGMRLYRAIPAGQPVLTPVDAILVGRRNNPAEPKNKVRALAVYNPIHYQELPELFMDFVCSLTGKSPSTTGAGSEGAMTKGPFNMLRPIVDLNNALVSYMLTGLGGFSSSAGYVGPHFKCDHDISLMIPEIWCRLQPDERDPKNLIANGYLEKLDDFGHNGEKILASRLGYRITNSFIRAYFGRLFDNPNKVFEEQILKPELQDEEQFVDGIRNICEAQERVAEGYFEDGSINDACPPLKALLTIMAKGSYEGKDAHDPSIRAMFTRESLLKSDWYRARLKAKQQGDVKLWQRHLDYIERAIANPALSGGADPGLPQRKAFIEAELRSAQSPAYLESLVGTLGLDPSVA